MSLQLPFCSYRLECESEPTVYGEYIYITLVVKNAIRLAFEIYLLRTKKCQNTQ